MNTIEFKIIVTGILILFIIIFGIWLSKMGKPLNAVIFAVHKIMSVLVIISTTVTIYHLQKNIEIRNIELVLIVVTGLLFLIAFVSGALMSFGKPVNNIILTIHKVTSVLIVISVALTIYIPIIRII